MKSSFTLPSSLAAKISVRMSEVAKTHQVDEIANAYARVSRLLEDMHSPLAETMTEIDILTVRTFFANYMR